MMRRGAVSCQGFTNLICPFFFVRHKGVFVFGLIDSSKEWEKCEEES